MLKLPPRNDKRVKAKTNTRKRVEGLQRVVEATVERGGAPDGPERLHQSVAKPNELQVASGESLARYRVQIPTPPVL